MEIKEFILLISYQNGDSWYRVYSDGFIEHSSTIKVTTDQTNTICGIQVNLIKPMRTRNYGVTLDNVYWCEQGTNRLRLC